MADFVVENKEKPQPAWVKYVHKRIYRENKNFIATIEGPTGSGKTYAMLRFGELLDKNFTADNVVFTGKELMDLINSGRLKKGSVILFDESQIDLSSRNWMSIMNKMLNYLITTFRHKNFILLFTSPYSDFIDSQTRRLFHAKFRTVGIDYKNKKCKLKCHLLQYNSDMKKTYTHRLAERQRDLLNGNNRMVQIDIWQIDLPSNDLIREYEIKKTIFTNRLNIEIMETLEAKFNKKKPLTELQEKIKELWEKGITNQGTISSTLDKNQGQISQNISIMRRKGYNMDKIPIVKPIPNSNIST